MRSHTEPYPTRRKFWFWLLCLIASAGFVVWTLLFRQPFNGLAMVVLFVACISAVRTVNNFHLRLLWPSYSGSGHGQN